MKIGVLALQGDVREHIQSLSDCGVDALAVKTKSEIENISALVIPGGESTTIAKLARSFDLFDLIKDRIKGGMPTYGSVKYVTALTQAAARFAGSPDLKIPEPTKTPSAPNCIIIAASAGVAMPPAVNNTTNFAKRL